MLCYWKCLRTGKLSCNLYHVISMLFHLNLESCFCDVCIRSYNAEKPLPFFLLCECAESALLEIVRAHFPPFKKNTFSAIYSFDNFCGSGKWSELSSTPHASWLVEICEHRHESMSWNSKWLLHSCPVGSVYFVYSIHNVNIGVANSRSREPESCRF